MKSLRKLIALVLVLSALATCLFGCKSVSLDGYTVDESTEEKDVYYVAMAVEDFGVIIVKLDAVSAPITVKNFVKLVRAGFYDGLTFHRVVNNFMIQGGDPNADGTGGASEKIEGEFIANGYYNPIKHERGVISMARSKSGYNTASSQFFICNSSSASVTNLDYQYAAFGHVVEGMDVVDAITEKTVRYADPEGGTIASKNKQAVISEMKVIIYDEAE